MNIIKSDIVSLHGAAISMIGGRPENQDDMAYLDTPLGFLVVVCDGMGGGPGGRTASYIVKHEFVNTLCECSPQTPRDYAFKMATAHAHHALEEKMKENPALNGMGSTFVAVLLNSQSAIIAHCGDSRCYRLHGKRCLFRTQDHSLVAELVRKKVMTEEDARLSPQSNVITRGLGSTNDHVPEIDEIPYKKGDRLVLCTDGVWGIMQHSKLLDFFAQPIDIQKLLSDLSAQIDNIGYAKGGDHDNHTIAMFELEEDSQLKNLFSWKKWAMTISSAILVSCLALLCLWIVLSSKKHDRIVSSQTSAYITSNNSYTNGYREYESPSKIVDTNTKLDVPDEALINILSRITKTKEKADSTAKTSTEQTEKEVAATSTELTQKIINRYGSAKVVAGKSIRDAQKVLDGKKEEIRSLIMQLSKKTVNSKFHSLVEAISRDVDNPSSWYVSKEPYKDSKLYGPTGSAKKLMDEQIERLKKLKKDLEQDTNN